jgi:hypothetical protein
LDRRSKIEISVGYTKIKKKNVYGFTSSENISKQTVIEYVLRLLGTIMEVKMANAFYLFVG